MPQAFVFCMFGCSAACWEDSEGNIINIGIPDDLVKKWYSHHLGAPFRKLHDDVVAEFGALAQGKTVNKRSSTQTAAVADPAKKQKILIEDAALKKLDELPGVETARSVATNLKVPKGEPIYLSVRPGNAVFLVNPNDQEVPCLTILVLH